MRQRVQGGVGQQARPGGQGQGLVDLGDDVQYPAGANGAFLPRQAGGLPLLYRFRREHENPAGDRKIFIVSRKFYPRKY